MIQYRAHFVRKLPDEPLFNVNMQQKDMLLALEMGRKLNVPLPTTAIANEFLTAARGMGYADKDFAVISIGSEQWLEGRPKIKEHRFYRSGADGQRDGPKHSGWRGPS